MKATLNAGGMDVTTFLALYRGETIGAAKMVAVTADSGIVRDFASRMLSEFAEQESDAVVSEIERGRRRALRVVRDEATR